MTPRRTKVLAGRPARRPADERSRRHRRHRHRGPRRDACRTATARGCPSACASWGRTSPTSSVVGDRAEDMLAALLDFLAEEGVDLICTSGGLGPTADDLTAQVVADFQRPARCASTRRWRSGSPRSSSRCASAGPHLDQAAIRESNRKQAIVPAGATVLPPVGTAPGLVVPPPAGSAGRRWSCCPGRRASCSRCGGPPCATDAFARGACRRGTDTARGCCGCSASRNPSSPRRCGGRGGRRPGPDRRSPPACGAGSSRSCRATSPAEEVYLRALRGPARRGTADVLFSDDGSTIDDQVAALLLGRGRASAPRTIAVAESCTGGPAGRRG